jgi:hypothetical protein
MAKNFKAFIEKELEARIRKNIAGARKKIRAALKPIIIDAIYDCPEMRSVRGGVLQYDFGLTTDPTALISWVIADSMTIRYTPDTKYIALFTIEIQPGNHENLYDLGVAYQLTDKGDELPWLSWLLEMGDSVIVSDFGVKYTNSGRTGEAIMVRNYYAPYRVNSSYSGTLNDNFITRALDRNKDRIQEAAWQTYLS